jgi:arginase family enzyme
VGLGSESFVPSMFARDASWGLVPSERAYADVDGDGRPDVAIGRLPVHTPAEADAVVDKIRSVVADRPAYLTFDIDCLDPSYAPGTGTPVCGGLTTHQALSILRGLAGVNVVGMDVVEVAPAYDVGEITALAAASVCMEMLYLYARRPAD